MLITMLQELNCNSETAEGAEGRRGQPRSSYYRQLTRRKNEAGLKFS
jgi:hypothetical protein